MTCSCSSQPPYPRLGECYRLLARALDTKSGNRDVDRLAREGDFDWQLIPQLRQEFISDPLAHRVNKEFSDFMVAVVDAFHVQYVHVVKSLQLDALTSHRI
ncbi:hypothetical protein PseBG33_0008 [Pseudomonas synxantha BG33R]|nr:hypothetical protein PseBG33_0008 [Pseudomonas synxantha BG33R]